MNLTEKLNTPGSHCFLIAGPVGQLEIELTVPEAANAQYLALLGHPHSLQGGAMNNKVVTTLVRVYKDLQIPSIRFNFRGVGQSAGEYDAGLGESDDMLHIARIWKQAYPNTTILFAGFSFGSYVAYRSAALYRQTIADETALITIAPSVQKYNYAEFSLGTTPWVVVQGDQDEVVSSQLVYDFAAQMNPPLPLVRFNDTGHFFHGKLLELRERLTAVIQPWITQV